MPDNVDERVEPANYRVRLFLSVDLSGSTAFKNSKSGESRQGASAPKWVTVFQQFYTDFPALFGAEFQKETRESVGQDVCPKLWKAVGDELVFCGTISNQKTCIVALHAFVNTLHIYRKRLLDENIDLDVKGAGWLAAFPEPNRTVKLRQASDTSELHSASEALEAAADHAPFDYDFLGKAIDTGFRVANNAKPERLILSVQLARLIVAAKQEQGGNGYDVRIDRPTTFKGVNKNEPYPVLYIDTMDHLPTKKSRLLERTLLRENSVPDTETLANYLAEYCAVVGTDEIMLKANADSEDIAPPASYIEHRDLIAEHLSSMVGPEFDDDTENAIGDDEIEAGEPEILEKVELNPITPDAD